MTPEERLEVIRRKVGRPMVLDAPKPKRNRYWVPQGTKLGFSDNFMGELRPDRLRREAQWLRNPDDPLPPEPCRTKRGYRLNPLAKIAQQLPAKLPVMRRARISCFENTKQVCL